MAIERNRVLITGLGPVTPIGIGADACWRGLRAGRPAAARRTLAVDFGVAVELPLVAMPDASEVVGLDKYMAFLTEQDCAKARDLGYSLLAMELALVDAGLDYDRTTNRIGMVQVFEAPGVERTVCDLFQLLGAGPPTDGPPRIYDLLAPRFYNMQAFSYVHLAAKSLGLHGFCTSVHNACSSAAFALETAAQAIRSRQAEVMIVTGGEAFETAVRLEWFQRLDLYARGGQMRPFHSTPTGFYVGEGGGAVVLESGDHAAARGARPYAEFVSGAFAHQGWKQTIPDVRSARLSGVIGSALDRAGILAGELDLIVPHGAATALSDKYEASCLCTALDGARCDAVAAAFKPNFGHTLAACGVMETIAALLCMKHQEVPGCVANGQSQAAEVSLQEKPNLETRNPTSALLPVPLLTEPTRRRVNTVLKLSTGFTGHDAALVFRRL